MAGVKALISGLPNVGKSTLIKDLDPDRALLISRDGKKSPLKLPKKTIEDFSDVDDLIAQTAAAIQSYVEKYDKNPETIVIDSISKIFLDIEARILARVKSFPYGVINIEISKFMEFLEHQIAPMCNLVMISHAQLNTETNSYELVNAGGSWGKKGGAISEVENALFVELKGSKRVIHHKTNKMLSRSLIDSLPESQPIEDFNLQNYVDLISEELDSSETFEL